MLPFINPWQMTFMRAALGMLSLVCIGASEAQVSLQTLPATTGSTDVPHHWVAQRGQAVDLALTPSGDAWALDSAGRVWRLPRAEPGAAAVTSWSKQPGEFSRLRATHDGAIWGIDARGTLYRLAGSLWKPFREDIRDVAASPDGVVWVLLENGQLTRLSDGTLFIPEPPANLGLPQSLLADEHGLPWLIFPDRSAIRFDGLGWRGVAAPADRLQSIAIGLDGTALAINDAGQLLRRQAESGRWLTYDGADRIPPARLVAVAADGLPWILDRNGQALAERPLVEANAAAPRPPALFTRLLTWRPMGVNARQVSVSDDGTVFSIAPDGTAWRWNGKTDWAPLNGKFKALVAGNDGRAWALDENNRLRKFNNGLWSEFSATAVYIAAGPQNSLWSIQLNGDLAVWNAAAQRWQAAAALPVRAQALAIGAAGEPWLIDEAGTVMVQQADRWVPIRGIVARSLGVGPEGTVYATTTDDEIYWLDRREMIWKPATGKARQIAVGPGGAPWAVTAERQLLASGISLAEKAAKQEAVRVVEAKKNPPPVLTIVAPTPSQTKPLSYQTLAGNLQFQDIGIGGNGAVFGIGGDGGLYCFSNPDTRFILASPGKNQRITVTPGGALWVVSTNGTVSRFENRQWVSVPEFSGKDIASGPDGQIWAAGVDGQSYRYNTATARFAIVAVTRADKAFKARRVAGGNADILWVVTEDRQLMRCEKGDCRLALSAATDVAVAPDNTVFALDGFGNVQRYDAGKKAFAGVNGQGVSLAVGPQGFPWLVKDSGQIQYAGLIYPTSKTVNTASCTLQFASVQTPVAPPSASLKALDDVATLVPGGSLDLLANDSFNGRQATLTDVILSIEPGGTELSLGGSSVTISATATAGSLLKANYKICPVQAFGTCATAQIRITVGSPLTVPGTPAGVSASAGDAQAMVSFSAPASTGGSAITGYTVTSSPGGLTASGAAAPITISGLANGTAYTFTVTATNAVGTGAASAASAAVTPTAALTAPGAPTGVSASAGNAQATVSFSAPASNGGSAITSYTATSNPGGFTASGAASPLTVTGLTNGTAYTFTVTATNAAGAGPASAASVGVTPQGAPGAPAGVSASAGNAQATVSFSAPASNGGSAIASYTVTSSPGGYTATGAASPLTVSGLANGTAYTFTVKATNAVGAGSASAASNSVTPVVAALTVPGAPTALSWLIDPQLPNLYPFFAAPASNGGAAITSYVVNLLVGGVPGWGTATVALPPATNTTIAINVSDFCGSGPAGPVMNGTITVNAVNSIGTGATASASFSTASCPAMPPFQPTGVSAVAGLLQTGEAIVSFTPPTNNGGSAITSYTVTSNPGGITATGAASPLTIGGLTGGISYTFRVTANNGVGSSLPSAASNSIVAP